MIRFYDILLSILILALSLPFLVIIAIFIILESKGGVIYKQLRVGKNGSDFWLYKFRSMYKESDLKGSLTIGQRDSRITKVGYYLRKYKLDELPQFFNVLKGDMCIVGPRPEVRKYVDLYTDEQKKVLSVKPGITDYASIKYKNENTILAKYDNPEEHYIKVIIPDKLTYNSLIINNLTLKIYLIIIFRTFYVSFFH